MVGRDGKEEGKNVVIKGFQLRERQLKVQGINIERADAAAC